MQILLISLFVAFSFFANSQEKSTNEEKKKRAEELKKLISEKRTELASLESELKTLSPDLEIKYVDALSPASLELGMAGQFGETYLNGDRVGVVSSHIKVEKVLSDKKMMITVVGGNSNQNRNSVLIIVANYDTKGVADGKVILPLTEFIVTGTEKIDTKTHYVIEPFVRPKKK